MAAPRKATRIRKTWSKLGVRHVRTEGGKQRYKQEIGEVIVRDSHLRWLRVFSSTMNSDELVLAPHPKHESTDSGERFSIRPHPSGGFAATTKAQPDKVLLHVSDQKGKDGKRDDAANLRELLQRLDYQYGKRRHRSRSSHTIDQHRVVLDRQALDALQATRLVDPADNEKAEKAAQVAAAALWRCGYKGRKPSIRNRKAFFAFCDRTARAVEDTELNIGPDTDPGKSALAPTASGAKWRRATPEEIAELASAKDKGDDLLSRNYQHRQVYVLDPPDGNVRCKVWEPNKATTGDKDMWKWTTKYTARHKEVKGSAKHKRVKATSSVLMGFELRKALIARTKDKDQRKRDSAGALLLMQTFGLRVGSDQSGGTTLDRETGEYVDTYGATTLKQRHISIVGETVTLHFQGKDNQEIRLTEKNPAVAKALAPFLKRGRGTRDEPVFPQATASSTTETLNLLARPILRKKGVTGVTNLTNKDLRTAKANQVAARLTKEILAARQKAGKRGKVKDPQEARAYRLYIAKVVSEQLGNTPDVALSAYIDPDQFTPLYGATEPDGRRIPATRPPGIPQAIWRDTPGQRSQRQRRGAGTPPTRKRSSTSRKPKIAMKSLHDTPRETGRPPAWHRAAVMTALQEVDVALLAGLIDLEVLCP